MRRVVRGGPVRGATGADSGTRAVRTLQRFAAVPTDKGPILSASVVGTLWRFVAVPTDPGPILGTSAVGTLRRFVAVPADPGSRQ